MRRIDTRLAFLSGLMPVALPRRATLLSEAGRNPDLVVLVLTILVDIRLFQGTGAPASFTLSELMIWLYCFPVLFSHLWTGRLRLHPHTMGFLRSVALYVAWVVFASACAIWARDTSGILQLAKNIAPMLVLGAFLLMRLRDIGSCLLLGDLYILWSLASCLLGLLQFVAGGPYLRPLIAGTEAKLSLSGDIVENAVVGLSTHPNALALSLVPAVMIALVKVVASLHEGRGVRARDGMVLALLLVTLMLTQAKAAMAWTAIAFITTVWVFTRIRGALLRATLVLAVDAMITAYSLHKVALDPASSLSTVETRYRLWQTAWDSIRHDSYVALLGDGMGYVAQWSEAMADWYFPSAHNGWLDQVLFFGFPGLIAYGWIWVSFFRVIDRAAYPPLRSLAVLGRAMEASVLAYAGLYLFEPTAADLYYTTQLSLVMMLGVSAASMPTRAGTQPDPHPHRAARNSHAMRYAALRDATALR